MPCKPRSLDRLTSALAGSIPFHRRAREDRPGVSAPAEAPLGGQEREASSLLLSPAESGAMDRQSVHLQVSVMARRKFSRQRQRRLRWAPADREVYPLRMLESSAGILRLAWRISLILPRIGALAPRPLVTLRFLGLPA